MKRFKRLAAVVAATAALLVGSSVVATSASADDASELPNCVLYVSTGVGPSYGGGFYTGSGDWYAYGPLWTVPVNSQCEDIQITWMYGASDDFRMRIRFYPSSGGNYANAWKWRSTTPMLVATNVGNGTVVRLEAQELIGSTQSVQDQNFDIRF